MSGALVAGELELLEGLASGQPLERTLEAVCLLVEAQVPGAMCSILLVEGGLRFRRGAGPTLPATYLAALDRAPLEADVGPCAAAVVQRAPVLVEDFERDPGWAPLRGLVQAHALRACWSWPILSGAGQPLGAFALYSRTPGAPPPALAAVIARVVHLARVAIERERAETALRRSEAMLARAERLNATGSFSWRVTGETEVSAETLRICELAPGATPTDELLRDLIHPEELPLLRSMLAGPGDELRFETRLRLADGRVKRLEVVASVERDAHGRPVEWTGVVRDVTALKAQEDALLRTRNELAHAARAGALGALTASIAHEVSQPLGAVTLDAAACLRWLEREPPELTEARAAAGRSLRDAQRAGEVVARLRALYSKAPEAAAPVDLDDAIRDVALLVRRELQRAGATLRLELGCPPGAVVGDRVQLQQVVLNLLLNGAEALALAAGLRALTVTSRRVVDADEVEVAVRDSGPGIEPRAQARLFDSFFTTKPGGMGMGLSISRTIVERHGGRIDWSPNADGPGVTFRVRLPSAIGA